MISLIAAKRDVKIEGGVDAGRLYWVIEDGRVLIGLNTDANAQVVLRHIPNPPTYNQLFKGTVKVLTQLLLIFSPSLQFRLTTNTLIISTTLKLVLSCR